MWWVGSADLNKKGLSQPSTMETHEVMQRMCSCA
jgi:hypothetical protein